MLCWATLSYLPWEISTSLLSRIWFWKFSFLFDSDCDVTHKILRLTILDEVLRLGLSLFLVGLAFAFQFWIEGECRVFALNPSKVPEVAFIVSTEE